MTPAGSGSLANADSRNAWCDSCGGRIGGARLFCLDCVIKGTETHNTVDLCCAKDCLAARITHRQDLEAPHDPNHRLVKVRTTVLTRQHGRAYTAAQKAFTKVEKLCTMIAEASQQTEKQEQTVPDAEAASSPEEVPSETPSKDDDKRPENGAATPEDTTSGAEDVEDKPRAQEKETSQSAENVTAALEDTASGAEGVEDKPQVQEEEVSQGGEQAQAQDQGSDVPSCGNCKGALSFPCWYCVKCEGQLSSDARHILGVVVDAFFR